MSHVKQFRKIDFFTVRKSKKKSAAAQEALNRLNAFLNAAEPEPVFWLNQLWTDQQNAITYKELREAILAGGLDPKTLEAWQKDYASFVNEHLKPIWTQAMQAGATKLEAEHPDFFFDTLSEGVTNWTSTHGAEWVTNISAEQQEAITAMIDKAASGSWTVEEMARAIRPTIGLTKPQSLANLNYYNRVRASAIDNGFSETVAKQKAQEAALKYAGRQHRARAYSIATTELAFAYNKGNDDGVKQAIQQGYMGKTVRVWSTAADDGVCEICAALDGVEIDMDGDFNFKGQPLYGGQKETPPAHPRCRCAVEYREVEPPAGFAPSTAAEANIDAWGTEPDIPEPPEPEQPATITTPDGMKSLGEVHIGNTGKLYAAQDGNGQEWLFKPAQNKAGEPAPYRAYVQEAAYKVQAIVDPDTAVPVSVGELDGQFGAFQQKVQTITGAPDFKKWQKTLDQLPAGTAQQFQREHVTDWLLGNYDAHGHNFLVDTQGRLVGIDKEQAFKYIGKDSTKAMSYAFHPNGKHGETEPVYNTLFRRFARGEIDLDLQDTLPYIKRVEAIPDAEWREIFREYAEALHGPGKEAEALLDAIVERKAALRETYRSFYSDLLTERTGKKQFFIWADEATQTSQPLAAITHTADALKAMNTQELKQLAKQKGIPYYNKFTKPQLVEAIADPVKAAEISAQTKAKLLQLEATRAERMAGVKKPPKAAAPAKYLKASDAFTDLSKVPAQRIGAPLYSDKGAVENLTLTARRITIDGADTYEITGKLTADRWKDLCKTLETRGTKDYFTFEKADDTLALLSSQPIELKGRQIPCLRADGGGGTIEVYYKTRDHTMDYRAWEGFFRLRIPATESGAADGSLASAILKDFGLGDLTATPTAADEDLLIRAKLLWKNDPQASAALSGLQGKALRDKMDEALKAAGVTPERIARTTLENVFDGYQAPVEHGILKDYKKAGLEYVWSGVSSERSVVRALTSPGLLSTNQRTLYGLDIRGSSPFPDMRRGGSDSVFTRIGVKSKHNAAMFRQNYAGGNYRIIIDPSVMERTDWYAYDFDNFGNTADIASLARKPLEFIADMKDTYRIDNEIMFRRGIPKENFIAVTCDTEAARQRCIDALLNAGIKEVNGIDIYDFVKVQEEI